jgi:uncharacterized protein (TIGR03790 family)
LKSLNPHPSTLNSQPSRILRAWLLALSGLVVALAGRLAGLAAPGDEVVVVYNRRMAPDSRLVAEHYAQCRGVPPGQVIGLSLPETENMTRAEYREQLERPLLRELEERHLIVFQHEIIPATADKPGDISSRPVQATIRYLVLCYGVPLRVVRDPALNEPGAEKLPEPLRRNEAAVDSELALLPRSRFRHPVAKEQDGRSGATAEVATEALMITGPVRNPFYGITNAALLNPTNGILLVTRLDGPSGTIARELVDKAMQAETNGLWGRAYFDARGITNGAYKAGDDWIRTASQIVRRQGFETYLDDKPATLPAAFPLAQAAIYAGWYDGNVSGPFKRANVEFMPGAIAYHLHSFSASTVRSDSQAWVGPLLAKGVTATMGCVAEPYLDLTPDLAVFFSRLLGLGFTFGEAACSSQVALSWQTTVLGDPLYRPAARRPRELHEELERRHSPLLEWSHLRVVNVNLATDMPPGELVAYLEQVPLTRQSAVLEQKLGDLYLGLGKVLDGAAEYQKALKLKPSPQQKIHLQLTLAPFLAALGREAEALELYQQFLKANDDYPDPLAVLENALPLAKKLNRDGLAEKWQRQIDRLRPAPKPATNTPPAQPPR